MHTGENETGLRKIIDLTRMISIIILILHFYFYCYRAFNQWQLTSAWSDKILAVISRTGLFNQFHTSKYLALGLLVISLIGAKGKKDEKLAYSTAFAYVFTGLMLYFASAFFLISVGFMPYQAVLYISLASLGYVLILTGGTLLARIIKLKFG